MKINSETKHQDLALHVRNHLSFIPVDQVKFSVIVMALVMYDVPLLLGLSYILKLDFLWIVLPFVVTIHLWTIRLVVKNTYSTQLEMILYMGIWGVLGAISSFIMVLGVSYYTFHITSVVSYIIITIATLISVYILVKYQVAKFSNDPTKERKESDQSEYMWLLSASPGMGYLIFQSVKGMNVLEDIISIAVIYFFAIFSAYYAAKFLHRYFFMKANMKYVSYQPTTKKERKRIMKQGVEIK